MLQASILLLCVLFGGLVQCEPDYCKRGVKVSEAYQHCFEEAHFMYPHQAIHQHQDIIDGCMVEAYANHTCSVVKPVALECFNRNLTFCDDKERLLAIADESGGACYGNRLNREFKEHILDYLQPVRADSTCFVLADRAYECYSQAGIEMVQNNPSLQFLNVDDFMPVANQFFDSIYNCFIAVYKSNRPLCEHWQIPLLLELQGTALPSLFGMHFQPQQMDRLELQRGCPTHHINGGTSHRWKDCKQQSRPNRPNNLEDSNKWDSNNIIINNDNGRDNDGGGGGQTFEGQQQQQQQQGSDSNTIPPFLQQLFEQQQQQQKGNQATLPPFLQQIEQRPRPRPRNRHH